MLGLWIRIRPMEARTFNLTFTKIQTVFMYDLSVLFDSGHDSESGFHQINQNQAILWLLPRLCGISGTLDTANSNQITARSVCVCVCLEDNGSCSCFWFAGIKLSSCCKSVSKPPHSRDASSLSRSLSPCPSFTRSVCRSTFPFEAALCLIPSFPPPQRLSTPSHPVLPFVSLSSSHTFSPSFIPSLIIRRLQLTSLPAENYE